MVGFKKPGVVVPAMNVNNRLTVTPAVLSAAGCPLLTKTQETLTPAAVSALTDWSTVNTSKGIGSTTIALGAAAVNRAISGTGIPASATIASYAKNYQTVAGAIGATITVADTTGFEASGIVMVTTDAGVQLVTYTSKTATTFAGCTGGSGNTVVGNVVQQYVLSAAATATNSAQTLTIAGGAAIDGLTTGTYIVEEVVQRDGSGNPVSVVVKRLS